MSLYGDRELFLLVEPRKGLLPLDGLCAQPTPTYLRVSGSGFMGRRNDLFSPHTGFNIRLKGGEGDDIGLGLGKNIDCT